MKISLLKRIKHAGTALIGTHKGEFTVSLYLAYAKFFPTNKQFKISDTTVFSFQGSKCIECWNIIDNLSLLEQLMRESFTSAIISESGNRQIVNLATKSFIIVISLVLNLGTLVFCHFVKLNILMIVYL